MTPLRAAVIGFGTIAQQHVQAYQKAENAELAAVADAQPERLQSLAQSGVQTFTDARQMLETVEVDVVSICTPPSSHAALAELALGRGVHVFCEKPLARTAADARRMVEAAHKANRLLATAFCHRFIPAVRRLRELIACGDLGRPLLYRNQFSGPFKGVESTWFSDPEISGGGTLMDTTVHSVDLFRYLLGEVEEVRALTHISRDVFRVEDNGIVLVKGTNGCLGTLESSWSVAPGTLSLEVRGDGGEAFYDYETLRWRRAGEQQLRVEEVSGGCDVRFAAEIQHFLDAVEGKAELELDPRDGVRTLEILEAAYASAGRL